MKGNGELSWRTGVDKLVTVTSLMSALRRVITSCVLIAIPLVSFGFAPTTRADTTFIYNGNPYNQCGGVYCNGESYGLFLSFETTLSGKALDNLSDANITSTVQSFKFADKDHTTGAVGYPQTITKKSSSYYEFEIWTNASGKITSWFATTCGVNCAAAQMQTNWDTPGYSFQPGADFSEYPDDFAGNFGFVSDDPGIWRRRQDSALLASVSGSPASATTVPEPSTWAMLIVGFVGLGLAGYRRTRAASPPALLVNGGLDEDGVSSGR